MGDHMQGSAEGAGVIDAADGTMAQRMLRQAKGMAARARVQAELGGPLVASGAKFTPAGTAGTGKSVPGTYATSLAGSFFTGPYEVGLAMRNGTVGQLEMGTYVGALVNVLVTGWILNMITDRPSPLDTFGIAASAAAQIGFGLFLSPQPTTKPQTQGDKQ